MVAILTLALGIGATTAIFTLVYDVLLKRLPYANPQRLVILQEQAAEFKDIYPVLLFKILPKHCAANEMEQWIEILGLRHVRLDCPEFPFICSVNSDSLVCD